MKNIIYLILAFTVTLSLISCSDDDPTGPGPVDVGSVSFTVSGDIEAELDGVAEFIRLEENAGVIFDFSFVDTPQTFSMTFTNVSQDDSDLPVTGAYDMGSNLADDGVFLAIFEDLRDGLFESTEYSTLTEGTGGTLEITESSSDVLRGTFSFTASSDDPETGEPAGEITISDGEFEATVTE